MRRLVVEADGGSRGNPGPAGYGAVVRDKASQEVLAEVAEGIGTATNNVAEYRGLIAGLEAAAALEPHAQLDVRLDSKLVIEQMSGNWKVKHPDLRPLASAAARLARGFAEVSYAWIPRARNEHADRLANEAMDAAAEGRPWVRRTGAAAQPPGGPAEAGEGGSSESRVARPEEAPSGAEGAGARQHGHGWMAAATTPTTMILLRHGETSLSGEKRFSGRGEVELTGTGVEQAQAAGRAMAAYPGIIGVVSSPLTRARQTAEIAAGHLDLAVQIEPDLAETDFGKWEGLTFAEVRQRWPDELNAWLPDPAVPPPGGESFAAVAERVRRVREAIMARYPQASVLVVTHVTPIKAVVADALLAPPAALYRMYLGVGCVCEVDWYPDGTGVVRSMNDTSHLQA